jgi:hypothetical protein
MEDKSNQDIGNGLCRCPYCPCCFCNEVDLKRHMDVYGASRSAHAEEFRKVHGRLEHGSLGGPE